MPPPKERFTRAAIMASLFAVLVGIVVFIWHMAGHNERLRKEAIPKDAAFRAYVAANGCKRESFIARTDPEEVIESVWRCQGNEVYLYSELYKLANPTD